MAHNTIDQNLSACLCMCARLCTHLVCFLRTQACFFFPFPLVRVCVWLTCLLQAHVAQVRAGKDAVYEIGIIYLGCGGGWWRLPGASTAGNIQTQEKKACGLRWSVIDVCVCVSFRGDPHQVLLCSDYPPA